MKVEVIKVENETDLLIQYQTAIQNPEIQNFLILSKKIQKALPNIKKTIGNDMLMNGEKTRHLAKNIEITTVAVNSPKLLNKEEVPEDYYTTEELDQESLVVEDGKIYQKVLNDKLIKENLKLGVNIPGYALTQTPRVSIKINGESI